MATEPLTEFEAKYPDLKARQAAEAWFKLTGSSYSPPYVIGDSLTHQRLAFNNAPRTGKHRLVFTSWRCLLLRSLRGFEPMPCEPRADGEEIRELWLRDPTAAEIMILAERTKLLEDFDRIETCARLTIKAAVQSRSRAYFRERRRRLCPLNH